jgi:predicted RNase H-like HicB family nuclease
MFVEEDRMYIENYYFILYIKIKNQMRQVVLYPGEDNMWVAECPSLRGCISQGDTKESAIENIKEAIRLYIEALQKDNIPVPEEKFESIIIAV